MLRRARLSGFPRKQVDGARRKDAEQLRMAAPRDGACDMADGAVAADDADVGRIACDQRRRGNIIGQTHLRAQQLEGLHERRNAARGIGA